MIQDIKEQWATLAPEKKRYALLSAMVLVVIGAAFISDRNKTVAASNLPVAAAPVRETVVVQPLQQDNSAKDMAARLDEMKRNLDGFKTNEVGAIKSDITSTNTELKAAEKARNDETQELVRTVKNLQDELKLMRSGVQPLAGPLPALPGDPQGTNGGQPGTGAIPPFPGSGNEPVKPARPRMRDSGDAGGAAETGAVITNADDRVAAAITAPKTVLPQYAIIDGILLNGMDAPTNGVAEKNPVPALVRVKREAILPNLQTADIRECFILVSGFASMSTERANLRMEGLSCVTDDGGVIQSPLNGYVIGEDGKAGMRGRLVSKTGTLVAKSLMAGVLSGIGSLAPQQVAQLSLGGGGQVSRPDLGSTAEAGLYSGIATAAKGVSQYYLDLAKETTPVVEIDAGRHISLVLTQGLTLTTSKGHL